MFYKNPYYDPQKSHHTPRGFQNPTPTKLRFHSLLKWQLNRWRHRLPRPPKSGYNAFQKEWVMTPNFNLSGDQAWWLFHSTILFKLSDRYIITDPIFSDRCSPFSFIGPKRKTFPHFSIDQLPPIDLILISHNHYDHLDRATILQLLAYNPNLTIVAPLGLKEWFRALGAKQVIELDWWESYNDGEITINAVPAQHWSNRNMWDARRSLWCGFVIKHQQQHFYFAGDTAYTDLLAQIGERYPIDLSFIPIGAFEPIWFMHEQHSSPEESIEIHKLILSKKTVPIHWGTFELADDSLDTAIDFLHYELKKDPLMASQFSLLKMGENIPLSFR